MTQKVFIVSDGTGRTAKQALNSALVQFEKTVVKKYIRPNVRTEEDILEIIKEASSINGVIVHTIVSKKLRDFMLEQSRLHDVGAIDIMGPLLAQLTHNFNNTPTETPGIFYKLNRAYFQRIEAVEFTLRHDDGQRWEELAKADIVLLGVSRTFKTPLSVYLAYKGWYVANVPIILDVPVPETLFILPPERIFCLNTYAHRLEELRKVRDVHLGGATGEYSNRNHIKKELNYALQLFKRNPKWTIINVTNKPVEEISSEILESLRKNKISKKKS